MSDGNIFFGIWDRPKFKKGHKYKGNPTTSKNTNAKEGKDGKAQCDRKSCDKCDRLHGGQCLVGTNICYGFDNSGHIVRNCPHVRN